MDTQSIQAIYDDSRGFSCGHNWCFAAYSSVTPSIETLPSLFRLDTPRLTLCPESAESCLSQRLTDDLSTSNLSAICDWVRFGSRTTISRNALNRPASSMVCDSRRFFRRRRGDCSSNSTIRSVAMTILASSSISVLTSVNTSPTVNRVIRATFRD